MQSLIKLTTRVHRSKIQWLSISTFLPWQATDHWSIVSTARTPLHSALGRIFGRSIKSFDNFLRNCIKNTKHILQTFVVWFLNESSKIITSVTNDCHFRQTDFIFSTIWLSILGWYMVVIR